MKTTPYVCLAASAAKPTHEWSFGQTATSVLFSADPRLRPERVGRDDTELRKKLPCETVDDLRPLWGIGKGLGQIVNGLPSGMMDTLYWKRTKPLKSEGSFGQAWVNQKGSVLPSWVRMKSGYSDSVDYCSLFREWCVLYEPDKAYLHCFTEPELANAPYVKVTYDQIQANRVPKDYLEYEKWSVFRMGMFGTLWNQRRYNLGALNYLPETVLGEDALDRLRAVDISCETIGAGVFIEICSLPSVLENFGNFSRKRALAKEIIGMDHFEIKGEPVEN